MGNTLISNKHCLNTLSMDKSATFSSYEAKVKTLLVKEFIISLLGAFITTSLTKFFGKFLKDANISLNSSNSFSVGREPNNKDKLFPQIHIFCFE